MKIKMRSFIICAKVKTIFGIKNKNEMGEVCSSHGEMKNV